MTIVVDLGCLDRNGASSLQTLAAEYKPDKIIGFDPSPLLDETEREIAGVPVYPNRAAAWTHTGTIAFTEDGSGSRVGAGDATVECFDFSAWLRTLAETGERIVVKMDIEGAEVPVLRKMIADGTDHLIDELLVEWHGSGQELEQELVCPVRRWWL